jgi:hypothetical protein
MNRKGIIMLKNLITKNSLRGRVIQEWEIKGKPSWDYEQTLQVCLNANEVLETEKLNPAPCFRQAIISNNNIYIRQWIYGCHFSWLNPR